MSYEETRARMIAAGPTIAELESRHRRSERREAWISAVLLVLSAVLAIGSALAWAGVPR